MKNKLSIVANRYIYIVWYMYILNMENGGLLNERYYNFL